MKTVLNPLNPNPNYSDKCLKGAAAQPQRPFPSQPHLPHTTQGQDSMEASQHSVQNMGEHSGKEERERPGNGTVCLGTTKGRAHRGAGMGSGLRGCSPATVGDSEMSMDGAAWEAPGDRSQRKPRSRRKWLSFYK